MPRFTMKVQLYNNAGHSLKKKQIEEDAYQEAFTSIVTLPISTTLKYGVPYLAPAVSTSRLAESPRVFRRLDLVR
jgi:hypothetical protein